MDLPRAPIPAPTKSLPVDSTISVTLTTVRKWGPCYDADRLKALAAGRRRITALEILDLDIPAQDKLWAVLRNDFFSDGVLRLFACAFAETCIEIFERERADDNRPRNAIDVARRYAHGDATDEERVAAVAAAWDAAVAAAGDARAAAWAAREAAVAAAGAAARDAAGDAAWDAALEGYVSIIRAALESEVMQ
jgi:hypothetical protein